MDDIDKEEFKSTLKPCPFCGSGDIHVEPKMHWGPINRPMQIISVHIRHWCETPLGSGTLGVTIQVRGRDYESAREGWNKRK